MFDFPILDDASMLLALDLIGRTLEGRPNLPSSPVPCPAPIVHLVDLFFQGWHLGPFLTRTAMRIDSQICGFTKKNIFRLYITLQLKKKPDLWKADGIPKYLQ